MTTTTSHQTNFSSCPVARCLSRLREIYIYEFYTHLTFLRPACKFWWQFPIRSLSKLHLNFGCAALHINCTVCLEDFPDNFHTKFFLRKCSPCRICCIEKWVFLVRRKRTTRKWKTNDWGCKNVFSLPKGGGWLTCGATSWVVEGWLVGWVENDSCFAFGNAEKQIDKILLKTLSEIKLVGLCNLLSKNKKTEYFVKTNIIKCFHVWKQE